MVIVGFDIFERNWFVSSESYNYIEKIRILVVFGLFVDVNCIVLCHGTKNTTFINFMKLEINLR